MIILESILVYGTCDQFAVARIGANSRVARYGERFLQRETPQGIGCMPVADTVVTAVSGRANVTVVFDEVEHSRRSPGVSDFLKGSTSTPRHH